MKPYHEHPHRHSRTEQPIKPDLENSILTLKVEVPTAITYHVLGFKIGQLLFGFFGGYPELLPEYFSEGNFKWILPNRNEILKICFTFGMTAKILNKKHDMQCHGTMITSTAHIGASENQNGTSESWTRDGIE